MMMKKMRLPACILLLSAQYLCGANRLGSPQQRKLPHYDGGGQTHQDMANVEEDPAFRDMSNGHQVATSNWNTAESSWQSSNAKAVPAPPQADEAPVPPGVINWWNTPPTTPTSPEPAPTPVADPVPEPTNPPVAADTVPEPANPPVAAGVVNWWNQPPTSPTTPATPVTAPAPTSEILFEEDSVYPGSSTIQTVGNNDDNDPNYELGRCEGDCDNDGGTLACTHALDG